MTAPGDATGTTNNAEPVLYHRQAKDHRKRVLVEPLVVVVTFLVVTVVSFGIATAVAGTSKLEELDRITTLALTLGGLASLIPIAMLAARAGGRDPGQLSSTIGRLRWRWMLTCAGYAVLTKLVSVIGYAVLSSVVGSALGLGDEGDKSAWVGWAEYLPMLALIVVVVPFQAAGEEYVMRGTLLQVIGAWTKSPWPAIAITSLVFALVHMTNIEASTFIFAMGAVSAWLAIQTGGLEAGIAEHAINNLLLFVFAAALSPEQFDQTDLNANADLGSTLAQTAGIFLYAALVLRRYRRRPPRIS